MPALKLSQLVAMARNKLPLYDGQGAALQAVNDVYSQNTIPKRFRNATTKATIVDYLRHPEKKVVDTVRKTTKRYRSRRRPVPQGAYAAERRHPKD